MILGMDFCRRPYISGLSIFIIGLIAAIQFCVATSPYTIDITSNPKFRWNKVVDDHKENIVKAMKTFINQELPEPIHAITKIIASDLDNYLPKDYGEEISGISERLGVSLGDAVLMNLIYDFTAFCTGIIANDHNGGIWHGRNLDYGNNVKEIELLKNLTIEVNVVKANKTIFWGVTYAGYVGIVTGSKPGQFSITVNERDKGSLLYNLISALEEFLVGRVLYPVSMIARMVLEEQTDFPSAVLKLKTIQLIAPVYYIVSGSKRNEGAVLVRNQLFNLWETKLNETTAGAGMWFLVQTNYDPWRQPPKSDDRRDPAIKAMKSYGTDNIDLDKIFKVLSTPPVLNKHTIYTSVFSSAYPNKRRTQVR